jgi:hypothetical protein
MAKKIRKIKKIKKKKSRKNKDHFGGLLPAIINPFSYANALKEIIVDVVKNRKVIKNEIE